MNKIYQSKEQDVQDLRFLKQMVINADKQLLFNEIDKKEYQYILSKVLANLDILEVKYGVD